LRLHTAKSRRFTESRVYEFIENEKRGLISAEIYMIKTRVTGKGQFVIPAALRRKYGIKEGTRIVISDNGDSIVLKPITEQYLRKLQGSLKGKGTLKVLIDEQHKDKMK
jgi:AbrB family looped-hinge helix DNA binding protein